MVFGRWLGLLVSLDENYKLSICGNENKQLPVLCLSYNVYNKHFLPLDGNVDIWFIIIFQTKSELFAIKPLV